MVGTLLKAMIFQDGAQDVFAGDFKAAAGVILSSAVCDISHRKLHHGNLITNPHSVKRILTPGKTTSDTSSILLSITHFYCLKSFKLFATS